MIFMNFARYVETELVTVSIMEEDVVLAVDNSFDDQSSLSVGIIYICVIKPTYSFNRIFLHTTRILFEYSMITGHQSIPIPVYAKKNVPIMKIHSAQSKKKQEVSLVNIADFKSV